MVVRKDTKATSKFQKKEKRRQATHNKTQNWNPGNREPTGNQKSLETGKIEETEDHTNPQPPGAKRELLRPRRDDDDDNDDEYDAS